MPFVCALEITVQQNVMNSTIHRFIIHVYIIKLWMRISFFTAPPFKDTKNRFNNVQKQDKCGKQNK
jgi:hypothetical protein